MREFGFKLSVISAPLRVDSWLLSAVFRSGIPATDVAQTLRFSRFIALPPTPLGFKALFAQIRALLRVWHTGVLQTSVFLEWIGPWALRVQKYAVL